MTGVESLGRGRRRQPALPTDEFQQAPAVVTALLRIVEQRIEEMRRSEGTGGIAKLDPERPKTLGGSTRLIASRTGEDERPESSSTRIGRSGARGSRTKHRDGPPVDLPFRNQRHRLLRASLPSGTEDAGR